MSRREELVEESAHDAPNAKGSRRLLLLILVLIFVCLGISAGAAWYAYDKQTTKVENESSKADAGQDLAGQVQTLCNDPKVEKKFPKIAKLCDNADTVAAGDPIPGPKGDTGDVGPAPTSGQIEQAVESYCSVFGCRGNGPTANQVANAVSTYCNSNGECRGPAGTNGENGAAGNTGDKGDTGDQGPPPSDAQVASAVASYCSSRNDCSGPKGEKGDTGATGADGKPGVDGTPGDTIDGGTCQFDGIGSITITIQTSRGPTTFTCSGLGGGTE